MFMRSDVFASSPMVSESIWPQLRPVARDDVEVDNFWAFSVLYVRLRCEYTADNSKTLFLL